MVETAEPAAAPSSSRLETESPAKKETDDAHTVGEVDQQVVADSVKQITPAATPCPPAESPQIARPVAQVALSASQEPQEMPVDLSVSKSDRSFLPPPPACGRDLVHSMSPRSSWHKPDTDHLHTWRGSSYQNGFVQSKPGLSLKTAGDASAYKVILRVCVLSAVFLMFIMYPAKRIGRFN